MRLVHNENSFHEKARPLWATAGRRPVAAKGGFSFFTKSSDPSRENMVRESGARDPPHEVLWLAGSDWTWLSNALS